MRKSIVPLVGALCVWTLNVCGQGTLDPLLITFDGPPIIPPNSQYGVQNYFESGFWFRGRDRNGFVRNTGYASFYPYNGTTYVQAGLGSSLLFSATNGSVFDIVSVDVAEYSSVVGPGTVHFVGYRHDGYVVTADLDTGGLDFHTVYFGPGFTGLDRVEIPNFGWSLDNLVVAGIVAPPPTPVVLGRVVAWGKNVYGQTNTPAGLTNVVAIAAGAQHSLALRSDGTIIGWGANLAGQTNVPSGLSNVTALAAGGILAPTANGGHSVALRADGTVATWGYPATNAPPWLSKVVAVSSGASHTLALTSDGAVAGWGADNYGESTGSGNQVLTNGWVALNKMPLTNVVAIAAGEFHSLALRSDGTVIGWGLNSSGQAIGAASLTDTPTNGFVRLAGQLLSNVVAIAAGSAHSLALKQDGTVVAWGANNVGQRDIPAGLSNVVAIAASGNQGMNYSLALTADGNVVSWGNARVLPSGLTNVLAISAGSDFSLALAGSGPRAFRAQAWDAQRDGKGFSCRIQTQSGRVYALQYKDSLADAGWTSLPLVAGTGHMLTLSDPNTAVQRFYRVVQW
jgi:hypothetical protein